MLQTSQSVEPHVISWAAMPQLASVVFDVYILKLGPGGMISDPELAKRMGAHPVADGRTLCLLAIDI